MRRAALDFRHIISWLVFLVWGGVFGIFYFSGNYVEFLNPQFGWLMLSGFVMSIIYFAVLFMLGPSVSAGCCSHEHHHEQHHGPSVLRLLILLVPVLFVINYGSWQLGGFAFDKRAVGVTRVGGSNEMTGNKPTVSVQIPSVPKDADDGRVRDAALNEIHTLFEQLVDKKIRTQGMYMSETPGLPPDSWVIFRFMVVCCAADAQPIAVMIKGPRPAGVADEGWVSVEGTLRKAELNGQMAVVIEAEKVGPVAAPKIPYLVPQLR